MINLFAGSINWNFPWWVSALICFLFIFGIIVIAVLLVVFLRYCLRVRSINDTQADEDKKFKPLNNYLSGFIIDASLAIGLAWVLGVIGAFGEWSNETWHLTLVVAIVLFICMRLLFRLICRLSPGEMIVKASRLTNSNYLTITLVDFSIGLIAYLYIASL